MDTAQSSSHIKQDHILSRHPETMEDEIIDDFGIFRPLHTFYFAEHPDYRWEAEKFGMDLDDVFTTLPK